MLGTINPGLCIYIHTHTRDATPPPPHPLFRMRRASCVSVCQILLILLLSSIFIFKMTKSCTSNPESMTVHEICEPWSMQSCASVWYENASQLQYNWMASVSVSGDRIYIYTVSAVSYLWINRNSPFCTMTADKDEQGRGGGYSYKQLTATTACILSEVTDEGTGSVGIVLFLLILKCNFRLAKTAWISWCVLSYTPLGF